MYKFELFLHRMQPLLLREEYASFTMLSARDIYFSVNKVLIFP